MQKANTFLVTLLVTLALAAIKAETGCAQNIHWVCGQVNDAIDCEDCAWHIVRVYYQGDEETYSSCPVQFSVAYKKLLLSRSLKTRIFR